MQTFTMSASAFNDLANRVRFSLMSTRDFEDRDLATRIVNLLLSLPSNVRPDMFDVYEPLKSLTCRRYPFMARNTLHYSDAIKLNRLHSWRAFSGYKRPKVCPESRSSDLHDGKAQRLRICRHRLFFDKVDRESPGTSVIALTRQSDLNRHQELHICGATIIRS
jgi:hypothetical protein